MRCGLACLTLLLAACGGSTQRTPVATDYDQACGTVADCVPVFVGQLGCCGDGLCPNAAVRATQATRVMNDVQHARDCKTQVECGAAPPCAGGRVQCTNGTCSLADPSDGASP